MTLVVPLVLTGLLAGIGESSAASASDCANWTGVQPPSPGTNDNSLHGVAVLSACNAWAVGEDAGSDSVGQTLIEHWSGSSWAVAASPDPGNARNFLASVGGASGANIWAVGFYANKDGDRNALILHWDGHAWKQVSSPSRAGGFTQLSGLRVVSATDAWAVGDAGSGTEMGIFTLHWNGHTWKQVSSPKLGADNSLAGVAATSGTDVWAVGNTFTSASRGKSLILHWNGRTWNRLPSPNPGSYNELDGVSATSATNAWAVGLSLKGSNPARALILHWNGRTWSQVASPNAGAPATSNFLEGVTATSAKSAWAVGGFGFSTFTLHWNGARWARVPSPNLGGYGNLFAVAASSASNFWAVGRGGQGVEAALAVHCC